ncbi:TraB/GumN family protein [Caulobacter endophyticus]|uniref:TraB/GumN family protein n=1 Tax=Caulobacter endophyticus TaxID=2172652 RepID=A0A2T9KDE0_9CAUL|nr:TraB/GumN family protein [Caulobacter endophyticus]PVM93989.1 TraB/GumN family protein [Caulobacter endophyticus]
MRRRLAAFAALTALAAASLSHAQAPPEVLVIDDPEANVVEELVVNARLPGPAWWKVSDADTTIYILGVPGATPKGMTWDTSVLERRLDGAFAVITPPVAKAGLTDLPALLSMRSKLKADRPLDQVAPDLAPRLARAWAATGRKDDGWKDWKPLGAGLMLAGHAVRRSGLTSEEPEKTIGRLARKHKVKSRPVAVYKAVPMIKAVVKRHSEEAGLICLEGVIDEVEAGPGPVRAAARAWAQGDVRAAVHAPRQSQRCIMALPGMSEEFRRMSAAQVDAVSEAMKTPGKAVAVLSLRGLVAEDGVLATLRARGFKVTTPDSAN